MDLLEKHYHDMQDIEFTVQQGKLWMLQTRNGKRTAGAAVAMAVDMLKVRPSTQMTADISSESFSQFDTLYYFFFTGGSHR